MAVGAHSLSSSIDVGSLDLFIDCASLGLQFSGVDSSSSTQGLATPVSSTPGGYTNKSQSSFPSFQAYWCYNWAERNVASPDSFPNNGGGSSPLAGLNESSKDFCLSVEAQNYTNWQTTTSRPRGNTEYPQPTLWQPYYTPPCCNTACDIIASAVQLVFWPTPAPHPHVTTLVEDGFTYTSPSVYLIYRSLAAIGPDSPACNTEMWGPSVAALTTSYHPTDVSSYVTGDPAGLGATINYGDLYSNCTSRPANYTYSSACDGSAASCSSAQSVVLSQYLDDTKHCYPELKYPDGLQAYRSSWSTCDSANGGGHLLALFDPPRALIAGGALAGATATQIPETPASAAPVSLPPQPGPSQTPPPTTPPARSGPGNDPGGQAPADSKPADPSPQAEVSSGSSAANSAAASSKSADPNSRNSALVNDGSENDPSSQNAKSSNQNADPSKQNAGTTSPDDNASADSQPVPTAAQAPDQQASVAPASSGMAINLPFSQQNAPNSSPKTNDSPTTPAAPSIQPTTIQGYIIESAPAPSAVLIDGQTVSYGGSTVQIAGTPVALRLNGNLAIGSSTISAFYPTAAAASIGPVASNIITTLGIGGFINSGFNGGMNTPTTTWGLSGQPNGTAGPNRSAQPFTGDGNRIAARWEVIGMVLIGTRMLVGL